MSKIEKVHPPKNEGVESTHFPIPRCHVSLRFPRLVIAMMTAVLIARGTFGI
jgi:hypothetical protein